MPYRRRWGLVLLGFFCTVCSMWRLPTVKASLGNWQSQSGDLQSARLAAPSGLTMGRHPLPFKAMSKKLTKKSSLVPLEVIERRILVVRGQKVILDSHLAELYEVPTKRLNEAVKRNHKRFPEDFMFRLTKEEGESLRFHIGTSNLRSQIAISSYGGRRYMPYVFTEQGVAMLSGVLNSERAIAVNIAIMRAFVRLRQILATQKDLAEKVQEHEDKLHHHDLKISIAFKLIEKLRLLPPPSESSSSFGFTSKKDA
jgi:hypothetical protein